MKRPFRHCSRYLTDVLTAVVGAQTAQGRLIEKDPLNISIEFCLHHEQVLRSPVSPPDIQTVLSHLKANSQISELCIYSHGNFLKRCTYDNGDHSHSSHVMSM